MVVDADAAQCGSGIGGAGEILEGGAAVGEADVGAVADWGCWSKADAVTGDGDQCRCRSSAIDADAEVGECWSGGGAEGFGVGEADGVAVLAGGSGGEGWSGGVGNVVVYRLVNQGFSGVSGGILESAAAVGEADAVAMLDEVVCSEGEDNGIGVDDNG